MAYIDTKYLGKCETCRHHRSGICNTFCDCGEEYSPDLSKMPTADVVPRAMIEEIFEEIEKIRAKEIHKCETLREKESDPSERKYWEGGYNSLRQLSYWIAELRKKYTEGK